MSVEERQIAAAKLKEKVFGTDNPDVREWHQKSERN